MPIRSIVGRLPRLLATLLLASTLGACAARGATPRPFPGATVPPQDDAGRAAPPDAPEPTLAPEASPTALSGVNAVVATALTFRGVPYREGGSDPSGFDCSGFVQYVFARLGTGLPREVRDQFRAGTEIDPVDVQPGDLVFFETVARGASHVGVAIGGGEFVHAPSSRGVVRVERFTSRYWASRLLGVRRVAIAPDALTSRVDSGRGRDLSSR
jgi:cell wall-associated NlpC family hydrolase